MGCLGMTDISVGFGSGRPWQKTLGKTTQKRQEWQGVCFFGQGFTGQLTLSKVAGFTFFGSCAMLKLPFADKKPIRDFGRLARTPQGRNNYARKNTAL